MDTVKGWVFNTSFALGLVVGLFVVPMVTKRMK